MSKKYDDLVAAEELPEEMSIIELATLGRRLDVDVDAIREKHLSAQHQELWEVVRAAKEAQKKKGKEVNHGLRSKTG
ncbi:unnamed protein product [marine sediment metagenome]|uniref:Uncharacterized protein n=1 Tax=marine sediment metagenome TaxID=412755 RepID=X1GMX4_9ZZZZ